MHCFRTGVEKGMKLCTAVQEGCGYKDTLRAYRYFAPSAKYFTVYITDQPPLVFVPVMYSFVSRTRCASLLYQLAFCTEVLLSCPSSTVAVPGA